MAFILLPMSKGGSLGDDVLADLYHRFMSIRGGAWRRVFCLCLLAGLHADTGRADEGLRVLATIAEEDRGAFYAPEMHRVEGELLLRRSAPATNEAEQCFRRAIALAQGRSEKSLELRAATSPARLLAARGRRDDARSMLAPIYGWFTEGFETADLRAANALLAEIG